MLLGCDISQFNTLVPYNGFGDFQLHRMTVGEGYLDSGFASWWDERRSRAGNLNGVYHVFTRDDVWLQCHSVMDAIKQHDVAGCLFAVDYEGDTALQDDDCQNLYLFIRELLPRFELIQPLIYCNENLLGSKILKSTHISDLKDLCSWWIADWSDSGFSNFYYDEITAVMRQFTNKPLCDLDMFFGSADGWKSLCFKR